MLNDEADEVGTDIVADVGQIRKTWGHKNSNNISGTVGWNDLIF